MALRILALIGCALTVLNPAVAAQKSEDVVRWNAVTPAAPVKPGDGVAIELKAEIEDGWHLYALTQLEGGPPPLAIAVAKGQPFTLDRTGITGPLPAVTKGTGTDPDTFHYDDTVALSVPVKTPKTVKAGKHTVPLEVTYQVCSGSICLRPTTTVVPVQLTIAR